jgi:BCD family chlorophyll transporter-like MFS transporter
MSGLTRKLIAHWCSLGPRYMPFADVATPDLPLRRLLRLSLFQFSVGISLVLLVGTLNRVMIVELDVPSTLVGLMLAMPLLFAPFRALIGFRSDNHRCALGWRRVPYIWNGSLLSFAGLSIMPFALLVLAGKGAAGNLPDWIGMASAGIAFLLAGAGVHIVQTAGLALATDLTPEESHAKVVGLMYVTLLLGMMISALVFGALLQDFTPGKLVQVIQACALVTVVLNTIAIWKQETRRSWQTVSQEPQPDISFTEAFAAFCTERHARRWLLVIGLGTLAFGMSELMLEPFGGQVLALSVSATTKLTALLAIGGLIGFAYASYVLTHGHSATQVSRNGALIGLPAFILVVVSANFNRPELFLVGNFLIGLGGALFSHGTLTVTMNNAPASKTGMALGAWGAVQASAAGLGIAVSGVLRDAVNGFVGHGYAAGYYAVYALEIVLLIATVLVALPLLSARHDSNYKPAQLGNENVVS